MREAFGLSQDEATLLAAEEAPGASGVNFIPYLTGERTPNWPHSSGALLGLRPGARRRLRSLPLLRLLILCILCWTQFAKPRTSALCAAADTCNSTHQARCAPGCCTARRWRAPPSACAPASSACRCERTLRVTRCVALASWSSQQLQAQLHRSLDWPEQRHAWRNHAHNHARTHATTQQSFGLKARELRLVGGGSKNPLWQQIVADAFQLPVRCGCKLESSVSHSKLPWTSL